MQKMECPCGYVYDPAEGDYERKIEPGTAFADLPDDWVCPKCGATKDYFYPADCPSLKPTPSPADRYGRRRRHFRSPCPPPKPDSPNT